MPPNDASVVIKAQPIRLYTDVCLSYNNGKMIFCKQISCFILSLVHVLFLINFISHNLPYTKLFYFFL